jgi:hydroxymethylpyrimidine/phosphomethylpyrimidine kinase
MRPIALTIAGSDPSGGAGIQADLKTFCAHGVYGAAVLTALTAQNTQGVSGIHAIPAGFVADQLESVLSDISVAAAKTGMLTSADIIAAVVRRLHNKPLEHLVVDPVMVSKSGHHLLEPDAVKALKRELLPIATLVTPNLAEAEVLAEREVETREDMLAAARGICALGAPRVLVKGGHLAGGDLADLYWDGHRMRWFPRDRIDTPHTHGTGCSLSAAVTANLALGHPYPKAVELAGDWLHGAILAGFAVGAGISPPDYLWHMPPLPMENEAECS